MKVLSTGTSKPMVSGIERVHLYVGVAPQPILCAIYIIAFSYVVTYLTKIVR